jgi:GGDEF domain-containing protein
VRPVADLPLEGLVAAADELAKAWAVALILSRPPGAIAEVPLEDLARDGPRLCVALLRAVQSDAELERLIDTEQGGREERGAARRIASLAGADGTSSVIAAVEALRGVLWEALMGELRRAPLDRADRQLLSDLADRLAHVCAMALAATLSAAPAGTAGSGGDRDVRVAGTGRPSPGPPGDEQLAPRATGDRGEVVIVDERESSATPSFARVVVARGASAAPAAEPDGASAASWSSPASEGDAAAEWVARPAAPVSELAAPRQFASPAPERLRREDDGVEPVPPPAPEPLRREDEGVEPVPPPLEQAEIQIRDERIDEGPSAWIRSIGRELERFAAEGRPFAVLLIELMEAERLRRSDPPEQVARLAGQVQRTLESELWSLSERAGASLTREAPGRFWLLAPGVEALRVRALAEQIEHAVRRSVSHHGEPVQIAVGTAVCPADGVQAAALAAHADVALYAARSAASAGGDGAAG